MQKENSFAYILMDEMKIKNGLAFSKSSHKLVGFCDLGSFNSELSEMAMFLSAKKKQEHPSTYITYACLHGTTSVQAITLIYSCNAPQFLHYWRETISCGMGGHRSIRDQFPTSDGSYK